jgi:hypothetical protein
VAEFSVLFACNILVLVLILRWRGLTSAEGIGIAFLLLSVVSDGFALLGTVALDPTWADYARGRMAAEVIPTLVHIFALILFAGGLALTDPIPRVAPRAVATADLSRIRIAGWTLTLVGLGMKLLALYIWGVHSLSEYLDRLLEYDISVRKFGFLDQGVTVAVFGLVLLVVANEDRRLRQALLMIAALGVALLLSTSKSGIVLVLLPFYVLSRLFSPKTLRAWSRPSVVFLVVIVFCLGLGMKAQIKYLGLRRIDLSAANILDVARATVLVRFSGQGLYSGYSFLVNRIIEDPTMALNGNVTLATFTGVVPRFIWTDVLLTEKPEHPFHAAGELVNERHVVDVNGNDAATFVGAAFADAGLFSLIPTMVLGGMLIGWLRKTWGNNRQQIFLAIGYAYFACAFGPSMAESGFLSLIYFVIWGLAVSLLVWIAEQVVVTLRLPGSHAEGLLYSSGGGSFVRS